MLHKDPDHRSPKTGRYAQMLLERFMKEQPKNSYEKVFGSSSTVIAAAQIAHHHGAHVENLVSLLHNPGSTQQRLTRIGGPHGGGGLGQLDPVLHGAATALNRRQKQQGHDDENEDGEKKRSIYHFDNFDVLTKMLTSLPTRSR